MGSLVVSVDAELGWGFADHDEPPTARVDAARDAWRFLLDLFQTHDLPATWAVVGHLFLEDCDGVHADHPAPEGWFARERSHWRSRPGVRFGPNLVQATLSSPVDHEVACHSFSHVLFDDPDLTREMARAEVRAAIDAAADHGVDFESFVFPRNRVGHRDVLAEFDFSCYRGRGTATGGRVRRTARKLGSVIDPDRVDLVRPTVDEYGLVDVGPSLFLFGFEGWARSVTERAWCDPIVRQATRGIDRASREDAVCHLWLHPNNVRSERDRRRMREVVAHAATRRDEGELRIETMAEVADRVRAAVEA